MKLLLLHPEDSPLAGPWVGQRWDAVFDLGRSGALACERWSEALGCSVKPMDGIRDGLAEIHRVRDLLHMGLGRLLDQEGLDWWELTAIRVHQRLETLVVMRKFAAGLPAGAEVWITRNGFEADALRLLLGARLRVISQAAPVSGKGLRHYFGRLRHLPVDQVRQIVGDKYDAGYRVRRHFHRRPRRRERPVVLVPSSYINMSLTGAAYSQLAPDHDFLLVATRASGRLREVPGNVRQEWLAAYAADDPTADEEREILKRWEGLKKEMESVPELSALERLGLTDDFPYLFAEGLAIRNAWRRVLNTEPVEAVLCCDDSNPYTHIPLLLASQRGLPTITCHHGALDGRYLIKTCHANVLLAKGQMEQDYLVDTCGVDPSVVEIGAPAVPEPVARLREVERDWIIFFSEPYEVMSERTEEIYREVIPGLAGLARRMGKTLAVKLHPSENLRDRQSVADRVLSPEERQAIRWLTGRFDHELLGRTWFGVTVQSSVAVEFVIHGVPCFLCDWLDLWPYQYGAQFRKFGVGIGLRSPADIGNIPDMVAEYRPSRTTADRCHEVMSPERFEEILAGRRVAHAAALRMQPSR